MLDRTGGLFAACLLFAAGCGAMPASAAAAAAPAKPEQVFAHTQAMQGLLPVHVDARGGRILFTLPATGADGVAARFLYTPSLGTGLGSAPTFLDRGRVGNTQVLAFRRYGKKVAAVYENPRFRGAETGAAASPDFATSIAWMGDVAATLPDGRIVVDLSGFLASDVIGIADALDQSTDTFGVGGGQGAGKGFKLDEKLSAADPESVKDFPDNIEVDAAQTFVSQTPGAEVSNIAPDAEKVSFTVHHSFVRLPGPGFHPRRFDPRVGGFSTQAVDYGAPLGTDVVREFANRFRLEKADPAATRSRVKKPIVYYVDWRAPEPIRSALIDGIGWWSKAFDAAGYIGAFQVKVLPQDVDPMDVRYNVVNWVDRATRGWSYGQEIVDPRTGEIIKGMVVIGSLRARQDIQILEGIVGANQVGRGGPDDPVQAALARIRQLGAHEVGHTLGFAHNFAASTQDRASVMDYPAPRIELVDGHLGLGDAYGVGVGKWDIATVEWLYGEPPPGQDPNAWADAEAGRIVASGLRYVQDDDARADDTAQPWASLWDDGPDATAELKRLMGVRRVAIDRFGLSALAPGEDMANLRRRFVPVWLLDRYQMAAAAKAIGGVYTEYAVNGGGHEASDPVPPAAQRAALDAVLATLAPDELRVPPRLVPLLSAPRNGSYNRQYSIELFAGRNGTPFDPLAAADAAAGLTLDALLAPTRLARLETQHATDANALGVKELLDRLLAATLPDRTDALSRRIAYRTVMRIARAAHDPKTTPGVAAQLDQRLHDVALTLANRKGDDADRAWGASLSRLLLDPRRLDKELERSAHADEAPPGAPIGTEADWLSLPGGG